MWAPLARHDVVVLFPPRVMCCMVTCLFTYVAPDRHVNSGSLAFATVVYMMLGAGQRWGNGMQTARNSREGRMSRAERPTVASKWCSCRRRRGGAIRAMCALIGMGSAAAVKSAERDADGGRVGRIQSTQVVMIGG